MIERSERLAAISSGFLRSPIVSILGLRQCGKTTLAKQYAETQETTAFFDLENPLSAATLREPMSALKSLRGLVVIDEIQRMPELFPILRVLADRPKHTARFLILGSASPVLVRSISESLAGRVSLLELPGLTISEVGYSRLRQLWLRGGLPRSFLAADDKTSLAWRGDFMSLLLERDIPQLGISVPPTTLRRFWTMLAHFNV